MDRDGKDDREELKRLIRLSGGLVDYDLPPPGAGSESGKLSSRCTYYVVDERRLLAESDKAELVTEEELRRMVAARRPATSQDDPAVVAARKQVEQAQFLKREVEARREARSLGIRPIALDRLLIYLGPYQSASGSTKKSHEDAPAVTKKEAKPETAEIPKDSPLMDLAREGLEALEAQTKIREAAVQKAEAQLEVGKAALARSKRLQQRGKDFVSAEEVLKDEAEARASEAMLNVARAELAESLVRVNQARRIISHPELVGPWLERTGRSSAVAPLDNRLTNVERKLDEIIKILSKTNEKL
jgi:hypothetical protein